MCGRDSSSSMVPYIEVQIHRLRTYIKSKRLYLDKHKSFSEGKKEVRSARLANKSLKKMQSLEILHLATIYGTKSHPRPKHGRN